MSIETVLIAWSVIGFIWWLVAWGLVAAETGQAPAKAPALPGKFLTVFKPLAPLRTENFREARGLESFIGQLDENSELLLGAHEQDRRLVEPFVGQMRARYPDARLRVVWRDEPDSVANPKIAWLKILAPHSKGALWLWSDADIIAPDGFLVAARAEYEEAGAPMVTWPYVVREVGRAPTLLDALFVNTKFFPGVLLLRRCGPVDFGLGAAMLFSRDDFESRVGWDEIGPALADDFVMGQKLGPVRIGRAVLSTDADAESWGGALLHYLRWSKTIRWNRPVGTALRVAVLPVLGWIAMICWHPAQLVGWLGLLVFMQVDVLFAMMICERLGCAIKLRHLAVMEVWSVARVFVWLICWLPWPVMWRGRAWWGHMDSQPVPLLLGPLIRDLPDPQGVDKA